MKNLSINQLKKIRNDSHAKINANKIPNNKQYMKS